MRFNAMRLFRAIAGWQSMWLSVIFVLVPLVILATRQSSAQTSSIVEILEREPAFSIFVDQLKSQGIERMLSSGEFTILAPSNAAFYALAPQSGGQLSRVLGKARSLTREEIENLIIPANVTPDQLSGNKMLEKTLGGRLVLLNGMNGRLFAGAAEILSSDTSPSNGVIYEIDSVSVNSHE